MTDSEYEATVWCPQCHHEYGQVFRAPCGTGVWAHWTRPAEIPTYCSLCECPTERKP